MMSKEEYYRLVTTTFRDAALAELGDMPFEITTVGAEVRLETSCRGGHSFRMQLRGEVFEIYYNVNFVYLDFVSDLKSELREFATEAMQEVRRVCDGRSHMIPATTRFRQRPMYTLDTARGETWRFIPA